MGLETAPLLSLFGLRSLQNMGVISLGVPRAHNLALTHIHSAISHTPVSIYCSVVNTTQTQRLNE